MDNPTRTASRNRRSTEEFQRNLSSISELARGANSQERYEIARELIELASDVLAYCERNGIVRDALDDPNARLAPEKVLSLRRKAGMLRSFLEGSNIADIAREYRIVRQTVSLNLVDAMRTLRKRTRTGANFMGQDDLLAGISGQATQLTEDEKIIYLEALAKYDEELNRRERGLPWASVWY